MEAKDTVMKVADIPIGMPTQTYVLSPEELRKELGLQAEISFKAGIKEVVEWVRIHSYKIDTRIYTVPSGRAISDIDWQAKLREWEVPDA